LLPALATIDRDTARILAVWHGTAVRGDMQALGMVLIQTVDDLSSGLVNLP